MGHSFNPILIFKWCVLNDKSYEQKQQQILKAQFNVQTILTGFQSKDDSGRSYYPMLKEGPVAGMKSFRREDRVLH